MLIKTSLLQQIFIVKLTHLIAFLKSQDRLLFLFDYLAVFLFQFIGKLNDRCACEPVFVLGKDVQ